MNYRKKIYCFLMTCFLVLCFSGTSSASSADKININTATIEELASLDRVGEKYAQRIIQYRKTNGPFKRPEDILKVKGIGQKTWETNKERITTQE